MNVSEYTLRERQSERNAASIPIRISAKDSKRNQWTSWGRVQAHTNTISVTEAAKSDGARAQLCRKMIPDQRLAMLIILWILMCLCLCVHMHCENERVKKCTNTHKKHKPSLFPVLRVHLTRVSRLTFVCFFLLLWSS